VTDQQDDIEDDVDAPKCKACGVPWTRHRGIIAICQQYLETVETLERVNDAREKALSERDEARRWWCYETEDARAEAQKRGWDCFKDAKP
jgi:uncharacterized Zn finger protein (UPF0148 family)